MRRLAAAAALVCLAFAAASAAAARPVPYCTATDLGIHYVSTQGATGRVVGEFAFVNVTGHACRLYGYPGVSAFARGKARIALHVSRFARPPGPHRVLIAPGHRAAFLFQTWDQVGGGPCHTSAILRFIPPGDRAYEQIAHRQLMCRGLASVTAVGVT
jgi:hypothetical protein